MPQMSPLMWFYLFIYFIMILYIMVVYIYWVSFIFFSMNSLNKNMNLESKMVCLYKFKW
uniref:ATP synthase F0 subunit 8 n=1 Tax=Encyrtus infelix TaxID=355422 RepID=A0A411FRD0_9HYME|nr:ATP synthase F0 subunit 8 [Encyrtus infelix]QBA96084.1 ATP synthase F0 subunit 8 [Encyrtus infelix]QBA96097.1 ATP synthase F0 subunit 8 [Encyrtus infelix]